MPRTKSQAEFDRWWNNWISKAARNRFTSEPRTSRNEPVGDKKRTAGLRPGNPHPKKPRPEVTKALNSSQ